MLVRSAMHRVGASALTHLLLGKAPAMDHRNATQRNAKRMRYPKFRRMNLFIGTGVIEAGCKTVIGSRCKQSGMFGTLRGANAILALRCTELNGRFEDYWEARLAS